MGNPYAKNDAQYGVRAAAAFVFVNSMDEANKSCESRLLAENTRHDHAVTAIHSDFQFAASTHLSTYHRTLEATAGDDGMADDED